MKINNEHVGKSAKVLPGSWNTAYDNEVGTVCSFDKDGHAVLEFSNGNRMTFSADEYEIVHTDNINPEAHETMHPRLKREDLERLALEACPASDVYELRDNIETEPDVLLYKIIKADQIAQARASMQSVCDYLNDDKALHQHVNWNIDTGKLDAAFKHAGHDLDTILTVFSRPGEPFFVDIVDLVQGGLIDRDDFLSQNPTKVGRVGIFDFYEDPKHGDEAPLIVDDGQSCGDSHYYDLPVISEIMR